MVNVDFFDAQHSMRFFQNRIFLCYLLLIGSFKPALSGWRLESHFSAVLAKEKLFYIYVPDSVQQEKKFPVLYLLHGVGGNYTNWMQASHVQEQARDYAMIIVLVDGGEYSWYLDSPMDSSSRYESYLISELLPLVERQVGAAAERSQRGICGLSMGGHGAISLSLKHPQLFGAASSLSGILDLTRHMGMASAWQLDRLLGSFQQYPENWRRHNCYDLILQDGPKPALFFDCGLQDAFALTDNIDFARRLDSLRLPFRYQENPGGHQWPYWDAHLADHLQFFDAFFKSAQVSKRSMAENFIKPSCYPNPFSSETRVSFSLDAEAKVLIEIYNRLGERIHTCMNEKKSAGDWQVAWDSRSAGAMLASGVYYVRCLIDRRVTVIPISLVH